MNDKSQKTRIAMLTPSSNSIVEPWCYKIISSLNNATVHFSRVEVLRIDNKEDSLAQFHDENMLKSFDLLSHVKPMVIGWNGTSASWLGFNRDRVLIDLIKKRTGLRAITSTLSILDALKLLNTKKIGLVTPYVNSIQNKIIKNFEQEGLVCVSERHFSITDNFSFGEVTESRIAKATEDVILEGAEVVIILCTNLEGAGIAPIIEKKTGVPVLDSVILTLWGAFRSIGINTRCLAKWSPTVSTLN